MPGTAISTGTHDTQQMLFTKGQTITDSTLQGEGVSYDYTLRFLNWTGDAYVKGYPRNDAHRYMEAAALVLTRFEAGELPAMVAMFCFERKAEKLDGLPSTAP